MINKLIVDGQNITLNESTKLPFTYTFSTSGVHNVRVGLDNTNEICAEAFKDCTDLTKVVTIPETITMIKRKAFENCVNLSTFNVPSSIEYIGPNVFDGCVALKEIKFNTNTPPKFYSKSSLSGSTNCYIPDGAKYVKVEDNSELVKDGSVQYYEKNILGGYDEVDYEALDDAGEYYYDNWTTVHDHYNVIEERFRVKAEQIQFVDEGVPATSFGTINAGDEGEIFPHQILPENATNPNIYLFSTNEKVLQVNQNGHFTTYAGLLGTANVNVCICTEPDYYGTYAFAQLRFRISPTQVITDKVDMELSFPENYALNIDNANIDDVIEFTSPTLTGDDNVEATITYASSNEEVVKVVSGKLKVVGEGTATITANYTGDEAHKAASATFDVTIVLQKYTIIFKDGDTVLKTITGPAGTDVSASDITLEKEGYDFNGWSIDGENAILPVDAITDTDITYIALWIETQHEEPVVTPVNLFYLGETKPTLENIDTLDTEEIGEWTQENPKVIDLSSLEGQTTFNLLVPANIDKNNIKIIDTNNTYEMGISNSSEDIEINTVAHKIYTVLLGSSIYNLYISE